ncbi:MAG: hypothetical protein Q9208_004574 [Pyrenodesmia sp. 3 TL-2023]
MSDILEEEIAKLSQTTLHLALPEKFSAESREYKAKSYDFYQLLDDRRKFFELEAATCDQSHRIFYTALGEATYKLYNKAFEWFLFLYVSGVKRSSRV